MIVHDSQVGQLASVFIRACAELTQARLRQRLKDTTAHRAAVAECRAEIDIILDLLLATKLNGSSRPKMASGTTMPTSYTTP